MAEKPTDGLFKRLGRGFDRYVGGLLGEDLEGMSPEEKAAARRSVIGIIGRGMVDPSQGSEALGAVTQARAMQRAQAEVARRTAAAEAEMPRIAGRLFGGTAGALESLPGGEGGPLTSRYRQAPQEALARLYGTQAGQDVMRGPAGENLLKLATEGVTGRTVGGAVYNPLTGGFARPPEAQVQTLTPQEVARLGLPRGTLVQRDPGGELKILREPPRMAAGGGGGGGGGGMFLTPAEVSAEGLAPGTVVRRRDGTIVQRPGAGGATPTEGPMAGMNERQRSGANIVRDAALQYAANITGLTLQEISKKSPVEIENLIKEKGGRVLQGGRARMMTNLPLVGDFARGIVESANADLIGPSTSGGAGVAMTQNPTGPITGPDVEIGIRQFPNPMLPVDVQAQMIRSLLERGGVVEQYDEKGNKVTR
jgi:hypothetical protein